MRYVSWMRARSGRLVVILFTILIYFLLLTVDALRFFSLYTAKSSSFLPPWISFGFSAFVALLFLAVGALVWLYARSRYVALLLFCFSFFAMITFTVETGAKLNDPLLSAIGNAGSALCLLPFAALLLLFPRNYFSPDLSSNVASGGGFRLNRQYYYVLLLYCYLAVLALLSFVVALFSALYILLSLQFPGWLYAIINIYFALALTGILVTIIFSYRKSSSLRGRQQMRIFVIGVILAFAPLLLLTILPQIFNFPPVDGQVSTLTAVLLPLALGYSILRYQILVFDMYIRRVVVWMAGAVSLAVLGYFVFLLSGTPPNVINDIFIVSAMGVLAPCVWWLAHMIIERLFFRETAHYRRLIEQPDLMARETFDLNQASDLLTLSAVNAFETEEVALLVLDEGTGYFQLTPPLRENDPKDAPRQHVIQNLLSVVKPVSNESSKADAHVAIVDGLNWLEAHEPIIERLAAAKRPLLLSEITRPESERPRGLSRYLTTSSSAGTDPLMAPVRVQGKLIGILVLGERGDHQQYAGPDFEAIELITSRFSSMLETARLYKQASQHVAILNALYSVTTGLEKTFESIEEVSTTYAGAAADALATGVEVWLYDEKGAALQHTIHVGSGPRLISQEHLSILSEADWLAWFYEGESHYLWQGPSSDGPSCLPQTPYFPFAWIPLNKGQQHLGMLVLTYSRPHRFSDEEKRILGMFANQWTSAIENAQKTLELREAYERQKELDRLKDQFIVTASHELRTPLTAVQGYIELLDEYNLLLAPEARADFIAKAQRGCDELTLMVGNIMDASHVHIDAENINLNPTSLADSVQHILEILEGVIRRENRTTHVNVSPTLFVMADDLRLRQILLNLVSNALKYSPAGTNIEILADSNDEEVTVAVRDYGLGVPPEEQERLFERFMRLERDLNSPARGVGLGLYISKQLVEAMGGHIWVESKGISGEGSTFTFTLKRVHQGQELSMVKALHEHQEV